MMAERQTRGRQIIPIQLIQNKQDLYATFSKRRVGIYKKASELCVLCGVDIGIIVSSPNDLPYSFFHPSMDSVIKRYINPRQPQTDAAIVIDAYSQAKLDDLCKSLDEMLGLKEEMTEKEKHLYEIEKTRPKGWWEVPLESFSKRQVKEGVAWLKNFDTQIMRRVEELTNGSSSSSRFQCQNAPDAPTIGSNVFGQNKLSLSTPYVPKVGINIRGYHNPPRYSVTKQGHSFFPGGGNGEAGPSKFFYPPLETHYPSTTGTGIGETGPSHYFLPLPRSNNRFVGGGIGDVGRRNLNTRPPPPPRPSSGTGIGEVGPSWYHVPQQSNNLSIGAGAEEVRPSNQQR